MGPAIAPIGIMMKKAIAFNTIRETTKMRKSKRNTTNKKTATAEFMV